ncbi:MAG: ABC transporter substrate-binding protein [Thermoleophilia bacterium]|nr:ABC transporter substrate-binding protein [Thermoleophilia bacterium]
MEPTAGSAEAGERNGGEDDRGAVVRTFLIVDVRGYTRFTQEHGDEEAGKLAGRFAELARDAVRATGGELIELRGDEALCAFPSARQALRAAVELQLRFRERVDGEPSFPLGIGIGLDSGEAVPVEGGYRGAALNLAARLCSIAGPGEILASETVSSLARRLEDVRFVDRRRVRLKGIERPVRVIEVVPRAELPPVPEAPRPRSRRRPVVVGAGIVVLLGAALAAGAVALTRDDDGPTGVGNAIAAVGADGRVSYVPVGTTPSTIAVGEGAVWVLNADDRTISKIDPETNEIVKTFGTGGIPTDLAVGEGAVWVGNGTETALALGNQYTGSVSRFDPDSVVATRTEVLPGPPRPGRTNAGEFRIAGVSQLAAGAGAVWATNPDLSLSRLDARTGKVVEQIPVGAGRAIAAGPEGVWVTSDEEAAVIPIDPETNTAGEPIAVSADDLWGIAVGGGSVWATDLVTGILWRIAPERDGTPRPIEVGFGASSVAYGAGAVWVTNFLADEVVRVDPRTNRVTRIPLSGTPPSVAVGADTAWVSIASAPRGEVLPASICAPVLSGGREPDVLIASDLPLQGPTGNVTRVAADAIRFVLRQRDFRAGRFTVGYQSCDDSTAQSGAVELLKCASNAKTYAASPRLVGIVGPWNSICAWMQIPVANRAPGPLAMISPSNTHSGLTHGGSDAGPEEPAIYYPTGRRNYVRVTGSADYDGAAGAVLADELGLRRVFVLRSTDGIGDATTVPFRRAAKRLGVGLAGSDTWNPDTRSLAPLADRVAATRPDGVFIGDGLFANGAGVVQALRARLGRDVALIAGDSFMPPEEILRAAGRAAVGMYVTTTAVAHEGLGPAGKRFVREFGRTQPGGTVPSALYVTESAQAAEVLLEAIERSDGTRASVTRELRRVRVRNGILGSFRFDRNGDITPARFTALRIAGSRTRDPALPEGYGGAVVDRVVRVDPALARP